MCFLSEKKPMRIMKIVKRIAVEQHSVATFVVKLITAVAGIITFEASVIASKGIEIVNIRTEAAKLELENSQLKISNAKMKSPQRIKAIAQQRLGMTVADQVYFAEGK